MKKIIVIVGPTASSKSRLAIKLAQDLNAEIINADSFQVYQELNAGINKPSPQQLKQVKHHLINSHSIYDDFDIKIFQDEATKVIKDLIKQNKNIIICGGSNLYVDALIKGYDLNKSISRDQTKYFDDWKYEDIYNYVLEKDEQEALKIGFNNKKRIIRAAQIIHNTNKKKSEQDNQKDNYIYDCFIIQTTLDRKELYEIIDQRTAMMLNNEQWIQEVKQLLEKDKNITKLQALKAIGYKQVIDYVLEKKPIDYNLVQQQTRNLAKKQITWCRNKYKNIHEYDIKNDDYDSLLKQIKQWL